MPDGTGADAPRRSARSTVEPSITYRDAWRRALVLFAVLSGGWIVGSAVTGHNPDIAVVSTAWIVSVALTGGYAVREGSRRHLAVSLGAMLAGAAILGSAAAVRSDAPGAIFVLLLSLPFAPFFGLLGYAFPEMADFRGGD